MTYKVVTETYLAMTAFLFLMFSLFIRRERSRCSPTSLRRS